MATLLLLTFEALPQAEAAAGELQHVGMEGQAIQERAREPSRLHGRFRNLK